MDYTQLFLGYVLLLMATNVVCAWRLDISSRLEDILFWVFGLSLVVFTGVRRFGAGPDDGVHYVLHYSSLCPITECLNFVDRGRDFLWYFLVATLKSVWPTPRLILWVAALVLFIKLFIIRSLSRYRLLALLIFVSVFYQTHDMATFRQSFAELFFLLGFWLMVRASFVKAAPVLFMSGLAHQQAYLTPIILFGSPWLHRWQHVMWLVMILLVLTVLGLTPGSWLESAKKYHHLLPNTGAEILVSAVNSIYVKPSHGVVNHVLPVVVYPLSLWALYTLKAGWDPRHKRLAACVGYSISFAYLSLWVFAGSEIWQYRFFYFYLLPIVFVVGGVKLTTRLLWMTMLVAGIYVVKYNVLHETFSRPAKVNITSFGRGGIDVTGYWVPCGPGCAEFALGSRIQLIPKAVAGYRFLEWSGDCVGRSVPCELGLDSDKQVIAVFKPAYKLSVVSVGEGLVRIEPMGVDSNFVYLNADGAHCFSGCQTTIDAGQSYILTAKPLPGYRFDGWSGPCAGSDPVCIVNALSDSAIDVRFVKIVE